MKHLLLLALGLSLAGTASAQTAVQISPNETSVSVDPSWMSMTPVPFLPSAAAPQASQVTLSYANPNGQIAPWQAPVFIDQAQTTLALAYAQRFTLPTETGSVDSLKIQFGTVTDVTGTGQGSVSILILKEQPPQGFHFPDLSQTGVLGSANVPAAVFSGSSTTLTLSTTNLVVPKEFFVLVTPTPGSQGNTSIITLQSEVKFNTPKDFENSRSVLLLQAGSQQQFQIMDNFFNVPTDTAVVNFLMEAFVQVEGASVARPSIAAAAMFPNPVASNGTLNIQHNEQIEEIQIVNMLGNAVQSWTGKSSNVKLLTGELPAGVYNVIVTTAKGATSEKLIVN